MPDLTVDKPFLGYDYYIFIEGTRIKAKNGKTGIIEFSHATNTDVVLQSCLDALSAGGTIFIGPGTYNIFASVTSANSVNIIGDGRGRTKLVRQITGTSYTFYLSGSNLTFSRLTLDGNYPTNTSNINFEIAFGGENILCFDIEVKAFKAQGISAGAGKATISQCVITGANVASVSSFGVWADGSAGITRVTECTITNCSLNGVFGGGITIVENCYFSNNASSSGGQIAAGSTSISIKAINNIIEPGAGLDSGVEVGGAGDWIVIGNRIRGQTNCGITTNSTPDNLPCIIKGNIVKNCIEGGICLFATNQKYFIVTENHSFDDLGTHVQKYGVRVSATGADHYIIKDNICYNNTVANISDSGTGSNKVVANNIS